MPKNAVTEWDESPAGNTDVAGIGITGASAVSNFDDALRNIMAQLKTLLGAQGISAFVKTLLDDTSPYAVRQTIEAQHNLGWKPCVGFPYSPTTDVSGIVIPIPSGSESLRITGVAKTASTTAVGFIRLSYDGGATYKSAGTDYNCASFYHVGASVVGATDAFQGYFNCIVASNDAAVAATFDVRVDFSTSGLAKMMSFSSGLSSGGGSSYQLFHGWSRTGGAPTHAILAYTGGALFTPATSIMAECF